MFATTFKTAAFIATAVVVAHATFGAASYVSLQTAADQAVMTIVKAEPIIVRANSGKALQVVKAERIEVRARAV